jgi:hypothetical protein
VIFGRPATKTDQKIDVEGSHHATPTRRRRDVIDRSYNIHPKCPIETFNGLVGLCVSLPCDWVKSVLVLTDWFIFVFDKIYFLVPCLN